MATPLTADHIIAALRAEGVQAAEHSGWRTHNRNHIGAWGPVNGIVIHHTAGSDSLAFCVSGNRDLPGPVCHTHLAKSGIATMVGWGRVNHAGTFAENAHTAVVREAAVHPRPDAVEPVDGNRHYYGIEIENLGNGRDPYPTAQYETAVRWAAAICRAHGWTANSVIGHKEGTRRKIDPSFDMDAFRARVAERLKHSAGWNPGSASEEEDPLAGMTKADICAAVWDTDGVVKVPEGWGTPDNPEWKASSILIDLGKRIRALEATLAAQTATIEKLVDAVSVGTDADIEELKTQIREAIESVTVRLEVGQ